MNDQSHSTNDAGIGDDAYCVWACAHIRLEHHQARRIGHDLSQAAGQFDGTTNHRLDLRGRQRIGARRGCRQDRIVGWNNSHLKGLCRRGWLDAPSQQDHEGQRPAP